MKMRLPVRLFISYAVVVVIGAVVTVLTGLVSRAIVFRHLRGLQ